MHRKSNHIENLIRDLRCVLRMLAEKTAPAAFALVTAALSVCSSNSLAQVDPTWVHRFLPDIAEKSVDLSTSNCHYRPVFGEDDSVTRIVRSVARFGEVKLDPGGACHPVAYAREEQIYVILEGSGVLHYGGDSVPVRKNDFMYLPPGITHTISASADQPCRLVVMGFRIPPVMTLEPPPKLLLANMDEVKEQTVEGHPSSVLYKLLVGDRKSTRDKIAAGYVVTSLFLMDFAPGGTNTPHHHETAEEIYLVLDGHGKIVAGGGTDGVEGFHPAAAGDAYFFRLNCTVGFYNSTEPGAAAHILAVRSRFPFHKDED
ncbi:MAG TPA: cupin domain-containing protein [Terriglobia bacterium]|nr:cupin domain-containing protein [Terriglobia bacterium]